MRRGLPLILVLAMLPAACLWPARPPAAPASGVEPLPAQQAAAYPETVTHRFVSLADFEDAPGAPRGHQQVSHFSIVPETLDSGCKFVVNVTRTGAGAMEVTLGSGSELVFHIPDVHNFTGYTIVSMALYSPALRDDLVLTLTTDGASWNSHRTLLRPGWNNVLVDIRTISAVPNFDVKAVRTLRLGFADAQRPVTFNLDDIMLIDNRRALSPVPPGMSLLKDGLNYRISLPQRKEPIELTESPDGLWRLGGDQAAMQLNQPGRTFTDAQEHLEVMGDRRVGQVEVLENNAQRIRLANIWYFPTQAGEWESLGIRQIRWEYTFYPDGRLITHMELNNAGGQDLGTIRILLPWQAAWWGGGVAAELVVPPLDGPIGRWDCLTVFGDDPASEVMMANHLRPAQLAASVGGRAAGAPASVTDYNPSQGCYVIHAVGGNCRFTVHPPAAGLANPVFRVVGAWQGPVSAGSDGLPIRSAVTLGDCALLSLPGILRRPANIEVQGTPSSGRQ